MFSIFLPVTKERSVILHGSKERRSRQNYFCLVVAMKEESGSHFPLPIELKKRQNNRNV